MKFEVEIDDALIASLSPVIGKQLEADAGKRAQLAGFALQQMLGWMNGQVRHQSMTEQHTEWLTELLPVFYPGEAPSAEKIFNNFSVPYGRAAYISRVLLEKQQTEWRKKSKANLLAALKTKNAEAEKNNKGGDAFKYVPVSIDNVSYRELSVILEELYEVEAELPPPVNKSTSPGRRTLDVPSMLFPKLIAKLEN
ncbi:hypothetical protein [Asticcacaulis machinosus]|uniref:Uncharacterized protein n=1 Tax=Asticcacaulis machinosus TaxID=2984211 RepID=A0ABT5HG00_9CAUL|nr:hypothetical protein [Asticcacaulis machinosus]MDC7675182.1 hypothetical protein [Asticcacaulis machinosus]